MFVYFLVTLLQEEQQENFFSLAVQPKTSTEAIQPETSADAV